VKIIENVVRGISMKFVGYTRSLELCSRMNYETENLDFIDQIRPGEVLFDLGACEGRFSIYASLKGIHCFSFEPEKRNFEALLENIELNDIAGILKPFELAIGKQKGRGNLKIGQPWAGGHQKVVEQEDIRGDLMFTFKEEQTVDVVDFDSFIIDKNLTCPDYLKIDIDGSEKAFVYGAQNTLKNPKLKGIIFELEIRDHNFDFIVENLKQNGLVEYARYQIPNEEFLYNIIFFRGRE
jgi:FkbM family methyltransferase